MEHESPAPPPTRCNTPSLPCRDPSLAGFLAANHLPDMLDTPPPRPPPVNPRNAPVEETARVIELYLPDYAVLHRHAHRLGEMLRTDFDPAAAATTIRSIYALAKEHEENTLKDRKTLREWAAQVESDEEGIQQRIDNATATYRDNSRYLFNQGRDMYRAAKNGNTGEARAFRVLVRHAYHNISCADTHDATLAARHYNHREAKAALEACQAAFNAKLRHRHHTLHLLRIAYVKILSLQNAAVLPPNTTDGPAAWLLVAVAGEAEA